MKAENYLALVLFLVLRTNYEANGLPIQMADLVNFKENKGAMGKILEANSLVNNTYFGGDIIRPTFDPSFGRNVIIDENLKWDREIPYEIHMQYDFDDRELIEDVLRELSVRLCVKFVPRGKQSSHLLYTRNGGCASAVGMQGGKQTISIGNGCESHGVILHETSHALGLWHEQSRFDRDDYVQIMWDNIQEGHEFNFYTYGADEIQTFGQPYDYNSIMHYGPYAFSENGEPTIVPLHPDDAAQMGQRDDISHLDLTKLRLLYECEEDYTGWSEWTGWSSCDIDCNQHRKRFCEGDTCTVDEQTETKECNDACVEGRDTDCPARIVYGDDYATITSTLYPYNYKLDSQCLQTFTAPPGETVSLKFEKVDVEDYQGICYYDWIKVYDGKDQTSPLLGTFCGSHTPDEIVTSSSNIMTVLFFADYSVAWGGFIADFYTSSSAAPLHICHFENGLDVCGWTDDTTADYSWTFNTGSTTSGDTGPSYDFTTGQDNGGYIFMESSSPYTNGMKARVLTPEMRSESPANCLQFARNMYGLNIGTLNVYLVTDGKRSDTPIFTDSGDHGTDEWLEEQITFFANDTFQLAFEGVRYNGYKGDMALDEVIIFPYPCNNEEDGSGGGEEVDECEAGSHNCNINAKCTDTTESFDCECNTGFYGDGVVCIDSDECVEGTHNCDANAKCINTNGSFQCECKSGFYGDGASCMDYDECLGGTHNCDINADCTNTQGSFECKCKTGYYGDGLVCTDTNECWHNTDTCGVNSQCVNTPGSYDCQCLPGYQRDDDGSTCNDIDECTDGSHACNVNASCINTIGSFKCECNVGFYGNGLSCDDLNECWHETDNCDNNAKCTNTVGSFTCQCKSGFVGDGVTCDHVRSLTLDDEEDIDHLDYEDERNWSSSLDYVY